MLPRHTQRLQYTDRASLAPWPRYLCRRYRRILIVLLTLAVLYTGKSTFITQPGAITPSPRAIVVTTPDNQTYPFHYITLPSLESRPLWTTWQPSTFFPSHIIPHPLVEDAYIVTNEVEDGSINVFSVLSAQESVAHLGQAISGGSYPAYCIPLRDKEWLICSNYGSPTISAHSLSDQLPYIQHRTTYPLPGSTHNSHPHQIILHPKYDNIIYVTDLGLNTVHVLRISQQGMKFEMLQRWAAPDTCVGVRHGVISKDGRHLYFVCQMSNTVHSTSLEASGLIISQTNVFQSTLYSSSQLSDGIFALSDIYLSPTSHRLYILNRRTRPPYPEGSSDTLAILDTSHGSLLHPRHVNLGCWQPREILAFPGSKKGLERLIITCLGGSRRESGVVIVENETVIGRWRGGAAGTWGIAMVQG